MHMIGEEMLEATNNETGITLAALNKLKKTDSFIKESHRTEPAWF
jgi:hypothetical protein